MSDATGARSNRELMLAGEFYDADDPELVAARKRAVRLAHEYQQLFVSADSRADLVLHELVGHLGAGVVVTPPFFVDYGTNLTIGAGTFMNTNLTALDVAPITIGEDCQIGPNVQLLTPTHPLEPKLRRAKLEAAEPITLGDNVWLGGGVIVCPGVTIGADSVVGAGAVVTRDIPAGMCAFGNPARVIKPVM